MNQLPTASPRKTFWTAIASIAIIFAVIFYVGYRVFLYKELAGEINDIRKQYEVAGVPCGNMHPEMWLANAQQAIKEGNKTEIAFYSDLLKANARHDACLKSMNAAVERLSANFAEHREEYYPKEITPSMINRKTHMTCNADTCPYGRGYGIYPEDPAYPKDVLPEPLPLNKYTLRKCRKFGCGTDDRLVYGDPDYPKVWWQEIATMDRINDELQKF